MTQSIEGICLHEGSAGHPDLVKEWQQKVFDKAASPDEVPVLAANWLLNRVTSVEQLPVVNNEIMAAQGGLQKLLEKQLKAGNVEKSKEIIVLVQSLYTLLMANIIAITSTR